MTPDDLSRRVAEIRGWRYVAGTHDRQGPLVPEHWERDIHTNIHTNIHTERSASLPPYASPGEWVLFGEMLQYLSSQKIHWEFFTTNKPDPVYGVTAWRDIGHKEYWGQSLNEAAARCVVAIAGEG